MAGLTGDRLSNEDLYLFQKLFRKGLKSNHIDLANRHLGGGEVVAKVGMTSSEDVSLPARLGAGDAILSSPLIYMKKNRSGGCASSRQLNVGQNWLFSIYGRPAWMSSLLFVCIMGPAKH